MALLPSDLESHTLGRVSADTPGLDSVLARALDAVVAYCGWHIAPEVTETLTLDGSGSYLLQLPSLHVVDVSAVRQLGEPVSSTLYDWSVTGQIELRRPQGVWSRRYRSIEVDVVHGWAELPPDLEMVVLGLAGRAAASPLGETSIKVGDRMSTYAAVGTSPLGNELAVMQRYRVRVGR